MSIPHHGSVAFSNTIRIQITFTTTRKQEAIIPKIPNPAKIPNTSPLPLIQVVTSINPSISKKKESKTTVPTSIIGVQKKNSSDFL
jgi:hypothetical protein